MHTYTQPPVTGRIANLTPEGAQGNVLTAETEVVAIHRGRHLLRDTFDGQHYAIEPGLFRVTHKVAKNLKARAVIPGTRNPADGHQQQSYVGILGLDPDEECQPLSDEEVARYGAAVEALDRASSPDPADRNIRIVQSGERGQPRRSTAPAGPSLDAQATEEARLRAQDALTPPAETDAARDAADAGGRGPKRGGRRRQTADDEGE